MRVETRARELALQVLYQRDLLADRALEDLRLFCTEQASDDVVRLAMELVTGCVECQDVLDALIRRTAENWELERMATSDRNILRLGTYELLYRPETPPKVAINEAIELAKRFSTENSPLFVNGVLDRIYNTRACQPVEPDPTARADLHVHSTASDGTVAPDELPARAAKAGLAAIALTDHDSVEGVSQAVAAGRDVGVIVVPGMELTAYADTGPGEAPLEMHIAGLFVDYWSRALRGRLEHLRAVRVERVRLMVERLGELGMPLEADELLRQAAGSAIGRAHVARELVRAGYCADVRQAFDHWLAADRPAYVPKEQLAPAEAIQLVHSAGGCAVLCHPAFVPDLEERLPGLVDDGLDALEVHYPGHTADDEKRILDLARERDLLVSGGSDFHGELKPDNQLGQEAVSLVELSELQQRAAVRV